MYHLQNGTRSQALDYAEQAAKANSAPVHIPTLTTSLGDLRELIKLAEEIAARAKDLSCHLNGNYPPIGSDPSVSPPDNGILESFGRLNRELRCALGEIDKHLLNAGGAVG